MGSGDASQNLHIRTSMDDIAGKKLVELGDKGKKAGASIAGGFIKAQVALGALKAIISGTIGLFRSFTTDIAEQTDKLAKMALRLDVNVDRLYVLGEAAGYSGSSLDAVANAIRFLQKNMAEALRTTSNPYIEAFEKLGYTAEQVAELMKRDTAEAFIEIGGRMTDLTTNADRMQVAMALMGRSAAEMLPLFQGGARGIEALTERAERFNQGAAGAFAGVAQQFVDAKRDLDGAITSIKMALATKILPPLTEFLERVAAAVAENRDEIVRILVSLVRTIGGAIMDALQTVSIALADLLDSINNISVGKTGMRALIGGVGGVFKWTGALDEQDLKNAREYWGIETKGIGEYGKKARETWAAIRKAAQDAKDVISEVKIIDMTGGPGESGTGEISVEADRPSWFDKFRNGVAGKGGVKQFVADMREATSPEALGASVAQTLTTAWGNFFQTIVDGSASAGEAFRALARNVLASLAQMAAQRAFSEILGAILNVAGAGAGALGSSGANVNVTNNNVVVAGSGTPNLIGAMRTSPAVQMRYKAGGL